jgi:hypothetical protein
MKGSNYAKVGNKNGRPGYRTQATFRLRAKFNVLRAKTSNKLNHSTPNKYSQN